MLNSLHKLLNISITYCRYASHTKRNIKFIKSDNKNHFNNRFPTS